MFVQPIVYNTVAPINQPANVNSTVAFYPTLVGNGTTVQLAAVNGMQFAVVDPFANPSTVPQGNYLGTSGGPTGPAQNY